MSRRFFVTGALCLAAMGTAGAQTLVFTAIPDEDERRLRSRFEKVADYLTAQLGVDAEYVPVNSYAAAVTAFRNNQVQLAWFGGLSGVQARSRVPGSEALAQGYEDRSFVTYFIAHAGTGLTATEDFPSGIEGRTFTFGDKGSTSGRLMPEFHIREVFGRAPERVFARVGFSGDHSRTIALVQSGAYEVGVVNYKVWENELEAGRIDPDRVSIIWKTPPYPDYQWTVRGDVDQRFGAGFKARIQRALLDMEDVELLASFPRRSFVPATNEDYQQIEDVARTVGLID